MINNNGNNAGEGDETPSGTNTDPTSTEEGTGEDGSSETSEGGEGTEEGTENEVTEPEPIPRVCGNPTTSFNNEEEQTWALFDEAQSIVTEVDDEVPAGTLVCDLFYEPNWNWRRRFTRSCQDVAKVTQPCDGTYACICRHGEKEYYRVSKIMPAIPLDYKGLQSSLSDAYLEPEPEVDENEDEGFEIPPLAIYIGVPVVSVIVLCCLLYCLCGYCAKRSHRVSFLAEKEREEKRRIEARTKREEER